MSDTLQELEQKMNVTQIVKNNPWPALAIAVGAGVILSGSRADVKAAADAPRAGPEEDGVTRFRCRARAQNAAVERGPVVDRAGERVAGYRNSGGPPSPG